MNRSMDSPRLVIVGAGVAGLAAGCYAARSGYRTTILEMHDLPGGLCTSWRRKGYLFDGSVAGLAGTSPEMPIYRLWQDLGDRLLPLYDTEDFGSVLSPDGRLVTVFTDVDRLESEFLAAFPADAAAVREFCSAVRACRRIDIPFRTEGGPARALTTLRSAPRRCAPCRRCSSTGASLCASSRGSSTDPFCFTVFSSLVHFGGPDVPLLTVLLPLAYADRRAAGIPLHGWLSFAQAIERRFVAARGRGAIPFARRGAHDRRRPRDRRPPRRRRGGRRRARPVGGRRAVHPRRACSESRSGRSTPSTTPAVSPTSRCR